MSSRSAAPECPWFRQPLRVHGVTQALLGFLLLGLAVYAYGEAKLQVDVTLKSVSVGDLGGLFGAVSGNPLLAGKIGGPLLVSLVGVVAGLTHLVAGIARITQTDHLERAPRPFDEPEEVVEALLHARVPTGKGVDGDSFFQFVRSNFTDRVDYVPRSFHSLLRDYLGYFVTVLVIFIGLFALNGQVLEFGKFEKVGRLYLELPFAGSLMAILIVVAALRVVSAAMLLPKTPESDVLTARQTFSRSGHPRTVFEELRGGLSRVCGGRVGDVLDEQELQMEQDPIGDVGRARGSIIVESKPERLQGASGVPQWLGIVHSAFGAVLIFGGLLFMLKLSALTSGEEGFNIGPPMMIIFVGLLAFSNGGQFFENAVTLLQRGLYRSHIYAVELKGTVFRSEVGAGMASSDSFRSSSVVARGEIFVDYAVAACISECVDGRGRRLIELQVTDDLRRNLKQLKQTIEGADKVEAPMVGIPIRDSEEVKEIARANAAVSHQKAATQAMHQQQAQALGQQPPLFAQEPHSASGYIQAPQGHNQEVVEEAWQSPEFREPAQIGDVSSASPDAIPVHVYSDEVSAGARSVTPTPTPSPPPVQPGPLRGGGFRPAPSRAPARSASENALPSPKVPQISAGSSRPPLAEELPPSEMPASLFNRPQSSSATSIPHGFPPQPGHQIPASMVRDTSHVLAPQDALSLIQGQSASPSARSTVPTSEGDTKVCPDCAETIKAAAVKCRFCGLQFSLGS